MCASGTPDLFNNFEDVDLAAFVVYIDCLHMDETSTYVVNEYLLSGLLSHTARHTHLNSKINVLRGKKLKTCLIVLVAGKSKCRLLI